MGFQNSPIPPINSETLNLMPPPTSAAVEEHTVVVEEEPFKFPPMVKDDVAKAAGTDGTAGAANATTEAGGTKTLNQALDWGGIGERSEGAKPGRRQAVPEMEFGPVSGELLPDVGIDFGGEAAEAAKQALGAGSDGGARQDFFETRIGINGNVETKVGVETKQSESGSVDNAIPVSGRARVADLGSFEKNFEEYLRRKNAGVPQA